MKRLAISLAVLATACSRNAIPEVPRGNPSLFVFARDGARCAWRQVDPAITVFSLRGDCARAHAAWTADGARAIVWMPEARDLRVVDLERRVMNRLAPPRLAENEYVRFGFSADGKVGAIGFRLEGKRVRWREHRLDGTAWSTNDIPTSDTDALTSEPCCDDERPPTEEEIELLDGAIGERASWHRAAGRSDLFYANAGYSPIALLSSGAAVVLVDHFGRIESSRQGRWLLHDLEADAGIPTLVDLEQRRVMWSDGSVEGATLRPSS